MDDLINRQDAKDRLTILVNEIEGIFADIRERNVDDSVCGLCEYDCDHGIDGSAFECLGFERDDCFKLKDEYREEWTDVKALPSAQVDLSGYSDRLWKSAYDRGYERCKQDAIDALDVLCQERRYKIPGKRETYSQYNEAWQDALGRAEGAIGNLLSAQPDLSDDGTLILTVPHGILSDVKRVMVDEVGTKNCKVMYQDAERKKGTWETGYTFPDGQYWKCSCCGNLIKVVALQMDFCGRCGAEMER